MAKNPETEPFFFKGRGRAAVLLVHGFTGTPYEMRGLGRALSRAGITAKGIRLPGHDAPESMTHVTRADWRRAVREAYAELRAEYEHVGVVGLSMGGLLSLDLTADLQEGQRAPDAVVSLAAPMFMYGWQARMLLPVVAASPLAKRWRWEKKEPGNIRDPRAKAVHPSIRWCMASALGELRTLMLEVRRKLHRVKAPLLIIHGQHDTTALVQSADILFHQAASRHREKIILPDSYHIITVDVEHRRVEREVVRWMKHWLKAGAAEQRMELAQV